MACEAAVVATATGGIVEVVVDGETGLLVPFEQAPRRRSSRATRRRSSAAIAERRQRAGRATRRAPRRWAEPAASAAVREFDWSAIARQTSELYRDLVS